MMKFVATKYWREFAIALPVAIAVLILGIHHGWGSPVLIVYLSDNTLTTSEGSWFVSLFVIGAVPGMITMMVAIDKMGRKYMLCISIVPMLVSSLLIPLAHSAAMLFVARFLAGVGAGITLIVAPIYFGEIASTEVRGMLSSYTSIMMALGVIVSYTIVPVIGALNASYLVTIITILPLLCMFWVPESPYYLVMRHQRNDAKKSLCYLRGHSDVEKELQQIEDIIAKQMTSERSFKVLFTVSTNRRQLLLLIGVFTIYVFSGTGVLLTYAHVLLDRVNVGVSTSTLAFILILIPIISGIISALLIEKWGKRPLLIASTFGCCLADFLIGLYFHFEALSYDIHDFDWIIVFSFYLFKFSHGLGIAGISFILLGEFFAANIKSKAVSICLLYLYTFYAFSQKIYQNLVDWFGIFSVFYLFAAVCALGLVFVIICIPETRGQSFREIQIYFGAVYKDDQENGEEMEDESSQEQKAKQKTVILV